jgi:hypothetical protein
MKSMKKVALQSSIAATLFGCGARLLDWSWEHAIEIAIIAGVLVIPCWPKDQTTLDKLDE